MIGIEVKRRDWRMEEGAGEGTEASSIVGPSP